MMIWNDATCPDFCLPRALLIYIHFANLPDAGYLFPRIDKKTGEVTQEKWLCDDFLDVMKFLVEDILKKDTAEDKSIIGTHILRKTAYLMAVWGFRQSHDGRKAQDWAQVSIFKSARHATAKSAAVYIKDADTLYKLVTREKHTERHRVSDWAPIHMEQMSQFRSILTTSSKYQRPIKELADWYVVERLGMDKMGTHRNVSMLLKRTIEKSIEYVIDEGPQERLDVLLATVPPEMRENFQMAIEALLHESVRGALYDPLRAIVATEGAAEDDNVVDGSSQKRPIPFLLGPNTKRQKPSCDDTIDIASERNEIKNTKDYYTKVALLVALDDGLPSNATFCNQGDRRWLYRVKPVISCFRECCGGRMSIFCVKYTNVNLSGNFKCADGVNHQFVQP
jgi:hypothetical protein